MQVRIEISPEYASPHAVIYADALTDRVRRAAELLGAADMPLTAWKNERIVVLKPEDIFMVRVEGGETAVYGAKERYLSKKRLYEWAELLGERFIQISRATLVSLSCLDSVEPGFSGTLLLKLKNGCQDYVSRRYLPAFKKTLGL